MNQRISPKWEASAKHYHLTSSRKALLIATVKNVMKLLDRDYKQVLDIGCGFGEIDIMLVKQTDLNIVACDISDIALQHCRKNVKNARVTDRIKVERKDIFDWNYPDESFDLVISFGAVSAATYTKAVDNVIKVLKPGGTLICDFINPLNAYHLWKSFKRFVILKKPIPYFLTLKRIRKKFKTLELKEVIMFNTWPPGNIKLKPKTFLFFEKTIGKLFRKYLSRVRLVKFYKPVDKKT